MSDTVSAEPPSVPGVPQKSDIESAAVVSTAVNGEKDDIKSRSVVSQQRADENAKKIAAQIEYYLGDFNLINDKFFRELVQKDEGWVPLETIMKCNRVKKYTSNPVDIIPSLQKFSSMFVADEEGKRIKRAKAFLGDSDEARADRDDRTVHVKRFLKSATVDAMQDYFSKFGPVDGLILNKFEDGDPKLRGKFKGSVSCIFKNKADAEKFLAAPLEDTMFDGKEMVREWQKGHLEERNKRLTERKETIEKSKIPGSVLHISTQRTIDYMKIKDFFSQRQPVEYVDHQRGQREARVRFKEGVAKDVLENLLAHNNNKLVIDGAQYKARVLEGKEEATYFATYWDTFVDTKNNRILRGMKSDPKTQFKYQPSKPQNGKTEVKADKSQSATDQNKGTAGEEKQTAQTKTSTNGKSGGAEALTMGGVIQSDKSTSDSVQGIDGTPKESDSKKRSADANDSGSKKAKTDGVES